MGTGKPVFAQASHVGALLAHAKGNYVLQGEGITGVVVVKTQGVFLVFSCCFFWPKSQAELSQLVICGVLNLPLKNRVSGVNGFSIEDKGAYLRFGVFMAQFWRTNFPDHNVVGPQQGMLFFARGKVTSHEFGLLGEGGKYARFEVQRDGRAVNVLLVDIKSNPFRSRREAFEHLVDLVDMYAGKPLMLMGDFNTPVDSVFMSGLESRLHHAFHTCGKGYDSTWPVPIPLLSLDHVWVSPDLPLHSCRLPWTWRSDHKPVLTILESAK